MSERRSFIKKLFIGSSVLGALPELLIANERQDQGGTLGTEEKNIRFALIGKGGMGTADTNTALGIQGTKLIAVCDLYDARINDAKKQWGEDIILTKDYKEILALKDVDAVIIATPDHWHQPIAIAAMEAKKHVYCEKPIIHKLKEGKDLIAAQQKSGSLFQMGSQGLSSLGNRAARKLVQAGAIGKVNFVDAQFTAGPSALNRFIAPKGANEETIWWDRFIGNAPKHSFDPQRFFSWRNWKDYGTGLAGDLFVHVISSIHFITDALGPTKVYTTGGIQYYKDGSRDTPDIMLGLFDYPDKGGLGAFKMSLGANIVDGISKKWGSTDLTIVGDKGALIVGWDKVSLKTTRDVDANEFKVLDEIGHGMQFPRRISSRELLFQAENGKGAHHNHFQSFFDAIRNNTPSIEDVFFGVRASSAALLSYESYETGKPIYWDAENLRRVNGNKHQNHEN